MRSETAIQYIERNRTISDTGCWLWKLKSHNKGYGRAKYKGCRELAHRFSWENYKGPIPVGMEVCHRCDVRGCINPDHLFLGTHPENMADARKKKKWAGLHGEKMARTVLTEAQAIIVLNSDEPGCDLAQRFGVSLTAIWCIRNKRTWAHLGIEPTPYRDGRFK